MNKENNEVQLAEMKRFIVTLLLCGNWNDKTRHVVVCVVGWENERSARTRVISTEWESREENEVLYVETKGEGEGACSREKARQIEEGRGSEIACRRAYGTIIVTECDVIWYDMMWYYMTWWDIIWYDVPYSTVQSNPLFTSLSSVLYPLLASCTTLLFSSLVFQHTQLHL
jgi:hypothetical protein